MVGSGLADRRSPLTAGPLRRLLNFDIIYSTMCVRLHIASANTESLKNCSNHGSEMVSSLSSDRDQKKSWRNLTETFGSPKRTKLSLSHLLSAEHDVGGPLQAVDDALPAARLVDK